MVERSSVGAQDSNMAIDPRKKIVVLAEIDLIAECLMQTLGKRFPEHDIVGLIDFDNLRDGKLFDVALILLYRISSGALPDILGAIRARYPKTSIGLVVNEAGELDLSIVDFVEKGVINGVLPLNLRLDVCLAAIELLIKGGEHFPSSLLRRLSSEPHLPTGASADDAERLVGNVLTNGQRRPQGGHSDELTIREMQILDLICIGKQNKVIAARLELSENTVKVHVRNIFRKLKVRNRTEAVSRYFAPKRIADIWTNVRIADT